jgi:predicted DNA-binding protein with PD1-like motif
VKHRDLAAQPIRRLIAVFEIGEDVLPLLQTFCETNEIAAGTLTGIGGFAKATVAFYNLQSKQYEPIEVDEQVEVLSFIGNVTMYQDKPKLHVHCVLGHRDGHTTGGHLLAATVRPTLEVTIDELSARIHRTDRPEIGIPLIEL